MQNAGGIPIHIDPTLFTLGPLVITWHGFFTAVGTIVGIWLAARWGMASGINEDDVLSVAMWGVIGAILGARLFHVVDQWDYYARDPISILKINEGGLAIFGTVVGGPLAGAIYAWRTKLNVARLADVAAPCLILGMGIGRIGDIINGEHHGIPAEGFPLAFTYTHPNTLGEFGVPIHLAVGYEMLLDLAICAFCIWYSRGFARGADGKLRFSWNPRYPHDGMSFWAMIALYSVGRFFVQFFRIDTIFAMGLCQAQLSSVLSFMVAVWVLVYLASRSGKQATPPSSAGDSGAQRAPDAQVA